MKKSIPCEWMYKQINFSYSCMVAQNPFGRKGAKNDTAPNIPWQGTAAKTAHMWRRPLSSRRKKSPVSFLYQQGEATRTTVNPWVVSADGSNEWLPTAALSRTPGEVNRGISAWPWRPLRTINTGLPRLRTTREGWGQRPCHSPTRPPSPPFPHKHQTHTSP